MNCPACGTAFTTNEKIELYDIHGAVAFHCQCGGRLVVKFWAPTKEEFWKGSASCVFSTAEEITSYE